jgi:hypothetical protein
VLCRAPASRAFCDRSRPWPLLFAAAFSCCRTLIPLPISRERTLWLCQFRGTCQCCLQLAPRSYLRLTFIRSFQLQIVVIAQSTSDRSNLGKDRDRDENENSSYCRAQSALTVRRVSFGFRSWRELVSGDGLERLVHAG